MTNITNRMGERLRILRVSLGFHNRTAFASHIGLPASRLANIENLNMRLNEIDFEAIGRHYPWALAYLAGAAPLELPTDAPAMAVSGIAANSAATPDSLDPADLLDALTRDPELKAAFQTMMIETLKAGLTNGGN